MAWCEADGGGYLFGLAHVAGGMPRAKTAAKAEGSLALLPADFIRTNRNSWNHTHRTEGSV